MNFFCYHLFEKFFVAFRIFVQYSKQVLSTSATTSPTLPLWVSFGLPHPALDCLQQSSLFHEERHQPAEGIQRRATKMIQWLELLFYDDRLREVGLLSLGKRSLQGDLISLSSAWRGLTKEEWKTFCMGR